MRLTRDLKLVLLVQGLLWFVCLPIELASRFIFGLRDPYQFFMLHGDATFYDLSMWLPRFHHVHTLAFYAKTPYQFYYPAGAAGFYLLFLPFAHRSLVYGTALLLTFFTAALLFVKALVKRDVPWRFAGLATAAGALMSYPLWYDFQRGNIEMWIWALCALGVWAFYRNKGYSAAACFGIAGAAKLYPFAYLGLFLLRKQWRHLAAGIAVGVGLTVLSLWVLYPDLRVSARAMEDGLTQFTVIYAHRVLDVTGFDHSLYTLVKRPSGEGHFARFTQPYMLLAIGMFVAVFFAVLPKRSLVAQVVAISTAIILFPPVSFDYTLLHVYTALCFLLLAGQATRQRAWQLVLLAAVCSPLTEFIYRGSTFGGQIHAVALLAVFILSLLPETTPAPQPVLEDFWPAGALNGRT